MLYTQGLRGRGVIRRQSIIMPRIVRIVTTLLLSIVKKTLTSCSDVFKAFFIAQSSAFRFYLKIT